MLHRSQGSGTLSAIIGLVPSEAAGSVFMAFLVTFIQPFGPYATSHPLHMGAGVEGGNGPGLGAGGFGSGGSGTGPGAGWPGRGYGDGRGGSGGCSGGNGLGISGPLNFILSEFEHDSRHGRAAG